MLTFWTLQWWRWCPTKIHLWRCDDHVFGWQHGGWAMGLRGCFLWSDWSIFKTPNVILLPSWHWTLMGNSPPSPCLFYSQSESWVQSHNYGKRGQVDLFTVELEIGLGQRCKTLPMAFSAGTSGLRHIRRRSRVQTALSPCFMPHFVRESGVLLGAQAKVRAN